MILINKFNILIGQDPLWLYNKMKCLCTVTQPTWIYKAYRM